MVNRLIWFQFHKFAFSLLMTLFSATIVIVRKDVDMVTIHLTGRITEQGELKVDLPEGLPPGDIAVTLELPAEQEESARPLTGAEIVAWLAENGGWEDDGLSAEDWVEEVRRKEREKRGW
jgi:hypothetical protein